ncbi:MAG: metalloregulator ArsR/SmtB family transcription factor [Candidatus Limnocylindrales bacterium]
MDRELLTALKALSDASRLRVIGLLATGRSLAVEELAAALDLTPGTVVHHLKRLSDAGLVKAHPRPPYVEYSLRRERLAEIGAALDRVGRASDGEPDGAVAPGPDGAPRPAYEAKVLRAFFQSDGRLESIPAQVKKSIVVLRYLAQVDFAEGREYPEREVNMIFALRHPDVASLRRSMIDFHFMRRDGGVYRLRPVADWPPE